MRVVLFSYGCSRLWLTHCAATVKATELRTKTKADLVKQLVRGMGREFELCDVRGRISCP